MAPTQVTHQAPTKRRISKKSQPPSVLPPQPLRDNTLSPAYTTSVSQFLRMPQVAARCGVCRASIYLWMRDGHFPKQRKLSRKSVGWLESEVDQWIATRETA